MLRCSSRSKRSNSSSCCSPDGAVPKILGSWMLFRVTQATTLREFMALNALEQQALAEINLAREQPFRLTDHLSYVRAVSSFWFCRCGKSSAAELIHFFFLTRAR